MCHCLNWKQFQADRTHIIFSRRCFFFHHRDRAEGEKWAEAVLQADHWHQVSLGGADHPDGRLLGRGPCWEARLRPHQDLCGQTQQVRLCLRVFSFPCLESPVREATSAHDVKVFVDATANWVQLALQTCWRTKLSVWTGEEGTLNDFDRGSGCLFTVGSSCVEEELLLMSGVRGKDRQSAWTP